MAHQNFWPFFILLPLIEVTLQELAQAQSPLVSIVKIPSGPSFFIVLLTVFATILRFEHWGSFLYMSPIAQLQTTEK